MTARLIFGVVLALISTSIPAAAQQGSGPICGLRDTIVNTLTGRFGETARSIGMGPGNRLVEVFASEETGTWSITVTSADGMTCLIASGQSYEVLTQPPRGEAL